MNWLNVRLSSLRAPEYIGSEPCARATWWNVVAYCAEQENGGRIVGARKWKDRQWQQTCGVMVTEVDNAPGLLAWEGDDLLVWNYPSEKEAEVRVKRESGKVGGERSGEARSKQPAKHNGSTASPSASSFASTEGEGKEKGKEKEKGREDAPEPPEPEPPDAHLPTVEEVISFGTGAGIPPGYCRKYHAKQTEGRTWLNKFNRLVQWKPRLTRYWTEDRPTWDEPSAVELPGATYVKPLIYQGHSDI